MGKRITQLDEMTTIANADLLYGVDVDDLTHSPEGTSKKFTKTNLLKEVVSSINGVTSDLSDLETVVSGLMSLIYPIGSIYTNATDSTNPATLFGFGTWEAFGAGRVLVGKASSGTFATAGATMGEETHTLTVAEMPSHNHAIKSQSGNYPATDFTDRGFERSRASNYELNNTTNIANAGSGQAHNNIQPSIVVYMWKRTA